MPFCLSPPTAAHRLGCARLYPGRSYAAQQRYNRRREALGSLAPRFHVAFMLRGCLRAVENA